MMTLKKGDIDATFGVLFDGIVKVIASIGIMISIIGFDKEFVFGKIIPGICLAVFIAHVFIWKIAEDLKKKEKRDDIVALPSAVTAGRLFIWLFSIMFPTYAETGNMYLALGAGLGANIISSILSVVISLISPFLLKIVPNVAIFGGLIGGSIAYLGFASLKDMFNYPEVSLVCLFVILIINFGKIKTKIPPILISIFFGIIIGFMTKAITTEGIKLAFSNVQLNTGSIHLSLVFQGIPIAFKSISIIFAWSLLEAIVSIQGIQQAISVGDNFSIVKTLLGINLISLISAFFMNPFPIGITWGYPTWKEANATSNYSLIIGVIYIILGFTGLIALVTAVIPIASVLPILIFIGLISFQGTLEYTEPKYFGAIALAMLLPIIEFFGGIAGNNMPESLNLLSQGAMIIAIIWSSIISLVVDGEFKKSGYFFLGGSVCCFFGLIHSPIIKFNANLSLTITYFIIGIFMIIFGKFLKREN